MQVTLEKEDLLRLINGTSPSYQAMNSPKVKNHGSYCGGFVEQWMWNSKSLVKLTEYELWALYSHLTSML